MRPRQQVLCLHLIIAELKAKLSFLLRVGEWQNSLSLSPILSHNQILQYSIMGLLKLSYFCICTVSTTYQSQIIYCFLHHAPGHPEVQLLSLWALLSVMEPSSLNSSFNSCCMLKVVCHAPWGNSGSHYILYSSLLLRCFVWSQSTCHKFFSFSKCGKNENSKYLSFKVNSDCSLSYISASQYLSYSTSLCLCAYNIQSTLWGAR